MLRYHYSWNWYGPTIGFCIGVGLPFLIGHGSLVAFLLILAGCGSLLAFKTKHKPKIALLVALICFAASLGAVRSHIAINDFNGDAVLETYVDQKVILKGVVMDAPDIRESNQRLIVQTASEKVLVITDLYPEISYGDEIELEGILKHPENFETDTGRTFDYISYLKKDGITHMQSYAKVTVLATGKGSRLIQLLYAIKSNFLKKIREVIPEPEASLLGGLLLGTKESLGAELLSAFRTAGLIHVVVLSGFNMSIIAAAVMQIFKKLFSFKIAIVLGVLSIILFSLMVGLSATVVRAGIMAEIALLALVLGRKYDLLRALSLAACIMVAISPMVLLYDPSFQLSFLATLSLIVLSPVVSKWFSFLPETFGIREICVATISTQLFLLPFLLWLTGSFSIVALPANLLVLPLIPLTMFIGFIAGTLAFFSNVIALPFALSTTWLLSYEIFITTFFASIPFASIAIPAFSITVLLGIYGIFGILWYKSSRVSSIGGGSDATTYC